MSDRSENYTRFLNGDENAVNDLVREYRDGLIMYINTFVGNIGTAEELAEDTFVKLLVKKPRDKGGSSFKTWLYTIGRNIAIDHLRRKKITVSPDELPEQSDSAEELEEALFREERKRTVHTALKRLRPEYRRVLWLVYFEDFALKDAAKIMGKSVHAAETLVYRARKALRNELEKEGFTYEDL